MINQADTPYMFVFIIVYAVLAKVSRDNVRYTGT